ncbi:MAG: sugar ABC transporter ATP-binding protein, partial [Bacteroidota bacterium]
DEPTASITEKETIILFRIIKELKTKGVSIIYISHRMAEIFDIADRVTVLKDGKYQGTHHTADINVDVIIKMMVGRDLEKQYYQSHAKPKVSMEVKGFSGPLFHEISFQLNEGEILALAGLVGAGRTEIARAIIGADKKYTGELLINGEKVIISHPADAVKNGIGYLPEHRKEQGLFLDQSVESNISVSNMKAIAANGFIKPKKASKIAQEYVSLLNIKTPSTKQLSVNLSGGNQQKLILARWLLCQPKVFIVDEPTHGVDVGAKAEIYNLLKSLAKKGMSILLISSELPEVLTLSDRILVLHNGEITAEFKKEDATEEEIMHYASGTKNMFREVTSAM